jgi:hypothetical protein
MSICMPVRRFVETANPTPIGTLSVSDSHFRYLNKNVDTFRRPKTNRNRISFCLNYIQKVVSNSKRSHPNQFIEVYSRPTM